MAKRLYQVQGGETLKSIARDRLADESRWAELAYINSLDAPYFVAPGTLLLLPADNGEIVVTVTKGQEPERASRPAADFLLSPAEWTLLAAGVFFLLVLRKKP